jgi:C-terminal processing protease CtpA/Prc
MRPSIGHMSRVTVTVAIGSSGIGLVVTDDEVANRIVVKDLRKMPGGAVNPSEFAGIRVGDEVEMINGEAPATLQDAVNMLKTSRDSVTITVLRR